MLLNVVTTAESYSLQKILLKKEYANYAEMVIVYIQDIMRLAILTIDDSKTVCDQQDLECDGISCKICQFNKIGVDVKFLREMIFKDVRNYLVDNANRQKDEITKAEDISCNIIQLLLKEETDERVIGEKVFKKVIH